MAHATAVQTKIAMIATIFFNIVICVSTLSAVPQPILFSWPCQVLFIGKVTSGESSAGCWREIRVPGRFPFPAWPGLTRRDQDHLGNGSEKSEAPHPFEAQRKLY